MTTIKSTDPGAKQIAVVETFTNEVFLSIKGDTRDRDPSIHISTRDLLNALGAVEMDTFEEVVRAHVANRVERALEERGKYWIAADDHQRLTDDWKARAEKAEAKVAAAREAADKAERWYGGDSAYEAIRASLADKPVFTLPTEAGARFTAQGKYDAIGQRTTFITLIGGKEPAYVVADKEEDILYHAHGVMEHYEDHRHEDAK